MDVNWGEKCDIWAVGVLAYELLSKLKPFDNFTGDHAEIWKQIKVGSFEFDGAAWRSVSEEAREFIKFCLTFNPSVRPTARQALSHKWIENIFVDDSVQIN